MKGETLLHQVAVLDKVLGERGPVLADVGLAKVVVEVVHLVGVRPATLHRKVAAGRAESGGGSTKWCVLSEMHRHVHSVRCRCRDTDT